MNALVLSLACLALAPSPVTTPADPATGAWRAVVDCPGGDIPFGLELARAGEKWSATLVNGPERRAIERVQVSDGTLRILIDPYDSRIDATVGADGHTLSGEWVRYRTATTETRLPFRATRSDEAARFPRTAEASAAKAVGGRWRVKFSSSEDPAVGIFEPGPNGTVTGTFLTTLGDYRYLEGVVDGRKLELSVFDGAHAFLFVATLEPDGSLAGDFWSRDSWHETWTAVRDDSAALPDAFALTTWTGAVPLSEIGFPDLEGLPRSLDDEAFRGKARMIVLFGTWCPNCYDQSAYLVELEQRFGDRGLSILGLAFEFGNDLERQAKVVRRYKKYHDARYPILIAGTNDKAAASKAFPLLDKVRAYPTTIFLDADGEVQAIYTGFSGPATGVAHQKLRERFETIIEELLGR